jgi:hypothetical protein
MERPTYTIDPFSTKEHLDIQQRYDVAKAARHLSSEVLSFEVARQHMLVPELCYASKCPHIAKNISPQEEQKEYLALRARNNLDHHTILTYAVALMTNRDQKGTPKPALSLLQSLPPSTTNATTTSNKPATSTDSTLSNSPSVSYNVVASGNTPDNAEDQKDIASSGKESTTTLHTQLQPTIGMSRSLRQQLEHNIDKLSTWIALQQSRDASAREGSLLALAQASVGVFDGNAFRPFGYSVEEDVATEKLMLIDEGDTEMDEASSHSTDEEEGNSAVAEEDSEKSKKPKKPAPPFSGGQRPNTYDSSDEDDDDDDDDDNISRGGGAMRMDFNGTEKPIRQTQSKSKQATTSKSKSTAHNGTISGRITKSSANPSEKTS